jgi:hypothetical protein
MSCRNAAENDVTMGIWADLCIRKVLPKTCLGQ